MDQLNITNNTGTPEERAALFDQILEKIMARDAFVPIKLARLNVDVRKDILKYRDEMIAADTDEKLLYTILKINNARKDPHVRVYLVENGLKIEGTEKLAKPIRIDQMEKKQAPIRFTVDYSRPGKYFLFVADYDTNIYKYTTNIGPEIGDKLIAVNGYSFADYFNLVEPYHRYATVNSLWWKMATFVSQKRYEYPPHIYGEELNYLLERKDGQRYIISLPYISDVDSITWKGCYKQPGDFRYPDFNLLFKTSTYDLYKYSGDQKIVLLDWHRFDQNIIKNMDYLVDYANENRLLDYAMIFDATRSRGGMLGAYAIQRISAKPFKTTFGNVRISDIVEPFIQYMHQRRATDSINESVDGGDWLLDWLDTDVKQAIKEEKYYSNNVPFKSAHLPKDSAGILQPAPIHFSGDLVCWFSPHGGSHLDQFSAMIADNHLAYTIGMPTGGYSNTWEWEETIYFPISKKPVVRLMYSMGHTIRPNKQLLEGNPADVSEYIPQTRDNYLNYYRILLAKTFQYLKCKKGDEVDG
ncbi:MAG: hypothetical protein MI740_01020 [Halanaerobiales bacterium]|nr:hypothetical protein [Halanaerobiales bacterium]